jgi:hypothetical protein
MHTQPFNHQLALARGTCRAVAGALTAVATLALSPAPAGAQEIIPAPPQSRPVALVGGTIHTVANGVI